MTPLPPPMLQQLQQLLMPLHTMECRRRRCRPCIRLQMGLTDCWWQTVLLSPRQISRLQRSQRLRKSLHSLLLIQAARRLLTEVLLALLLLLLLAALLLPTLAMRQRTVLGVLP